MNGSTSNSSYLPLLWCTLESSACPHLRYIYHPHEGHVGKGADVVNQPLQHEEPPWSPDVLRVHGESESPAIAI